MSTEVKVAAKKKQEEIKVREKAEKEKQGRIKKLEFPKDEDLEGMDL